MNNSGSSIAAEYTLQGLAIVFILIGIANRVIHGMAWFWSKWKLHQKRSWPQDVPLPGVSILKPLVGVDPNLHSNLETFFTLMYPLDKFEILFCVHEKSDPAVEVVDKLMKEFPRINARLFIGGENVGVNPKINNMHPAYTSSNLAFELVLISDSGIRMKPDTLMDMVSYMDEKTGLVHQVPFTCDRPSLGFPATLEKVFFGTNHGRIYLGSDLVGVNCATGMSELIRKELLEEVGGMKAFGCFLAEDFFFAKSIVERGWKISIAGQPAWQNSGNCSVHSLMARVSRWARLRFAMVPPTLIGEPIGESVPSGIGLAFGCHQLLDWDPIAVFLVHMLLWCIMDYILLKLMQNGTLPFSRTEYVIAWLFREFTFPYYFLQSVIFPNIKWREGYYRLNWGGVVEKVPPPKSSRKVIEV